MRLVKSLPAGIIIARPSKPLAPVVLKISTHARPSKPLAPVMLKISTHARSLSVQPKSHLRRAGGGSSLARESRCGHSSVEAVSDAGGLARTKSQCVSMTCQPSTTHGGSHPAHAAAPSAIAGRAHSPGLAPQAPQVSQVAGSSQENFGIRVPADAHSEPWPSHDASCGATRPSGCASCGGAAQGSLAGQNAVLLSPRGRARPPVSSPAPAGSDGPDTAPRSALVATCAELDHHAAPHSDVVTGPSQEVIQREFAHHHPGVARLNNGSFGSAPKRVLDEQAQCNLQWLRHPDEFCWDPLSQGFLAARTGLADLIGAPHVDEVVLLENATTGAAVVAVDCMWGFLEGRYERGDAIIMFDCAYGAVKKCFQGYCVRAGAQLLEYKMPFPVRSNEEIVSTFQEFLRKEKAENPARAMRLAVLDHVTSMPAIVLPIRDLVRVCRAHGVEQVFVDGAHAIGSVHIDVHDIDADYYMANVHKWLFAPPVVAFFHAKPHHLARLHHPVVSHSYGTGLLNESYWVGTRDYSAYLSVPTAIQFMKEFFGDLESYRKSNHDNVVEMGEMLARSWGTCLGAPPDLFASMAMVGLPPGLNIHSQDDALKMRSRLREEFQVEVPLCYSGCSMLQVDGFTVVAYARISHQVYNKLEDYYALRDAVNSILAQGDNQDSVTSTTTEEV